MPLVNCDDYQPSGLYKYGHFNTVMSHFRRSKAKVRFSRSRIFTPDDDFIDIDSILNGSKILVMLLHGLEGSSESSYIHTFSQMLSSSGLYDVRVMNYRGCSGTMNQQVGMYHSGATEDLDSVFSHYQNQYDEIYAIGFSLGGNLILKYLGEQKFASSQWITKAVAISPPTHLESCSYKIMERQNFVYQKRFLTSLKSKALEKAKLYPEQLVSSTIKSIKKIYEFDDVITGPIHGFADARDYYSKSSSKQYLDQINKPTLIITAVDDPFLSIEAIPYEEAKRNEMLFLAASEYGGHVGFGGHKKEISWMLEKSIEFISA